MMMMMPNCNIQPVKALDIAISSELCVSGIFYFYFTLFSINYNYTVFQKKRDHIFDDKLK